MPTLLSRNGCPLTLSMHSRDSAILRSRVASALGCDVKLIKVAGLDPSDWMGLDIPKKFHTTARVYMIAWQQGVLDGLDSHYGRIIGEAQVDVSSL